MTSWRLLWPCELFCWLYHGLSFITNQDHQELDRRLPGILGLVYVFRLVGGRAQIEGHTGLDSYIRLPFLLHDTGTLHRVNELVARMIVFPGRLPWWDHDDPHMSFFPFKPF